MTMTFEEAKQKVAEKYECHTWDEMIGYMDEGFPDLPLSNRTAYNEAAELWQQSNLERIKELEEAVKELSNIDSIQLIGNPSKRFNELEGKGWDWRSFYNGWLEGRVSYMRQLKELLK